jgi:acyl-coenzyme A thioesterase PaaI-like protein
MRAGVLRHLMNLWPPFLFAGIRVAHLADDWRSAEVEMRLRWYNRNWVGVHFGGSLFAMTDPFYMLLLIHLLGPDYVVWDKAAAIDFVRPGRGRVRAQFRVDDDLLASIRAATADGSAHRPVLPVDILDEAGEVVARLERTLHVRLKRRPGA